MSNSVELCTACGGIMRPFSYIIESMEDTLILEGKTYVSSRRAAEVTGYATDYVGQLCRNGKVTARRVGRSWYVEEDSLKRHYHASVPGARSHKTKHEANETETLPTQDDSEDTQAGTTPAKETPARTDTVKVRKINYPYISSLYRDAEDEDGDDTSDIEEHPPSTHLKNTDTTDDPKAHYIPVTIVEDADEEHHYSYPDASPQEHTYPEEDLYYTEFAEEEIRHKREVAVPQYRKYIKPLAAYLKQDRNPFLTMLGAGLLLLLIAGFLFGLLSENTIKYTRNTDTARYDNTLTATG